MLHGADVRITRRSFYSGQCTGKRLTVVGEGRGVSIRTEGSKVAPPLKLCMTTT